MSREVLDDDPSAPTDPDGDPGGGAATLVVSRGRPPDAAEPASRRRRRPPAAVVTAMVAALVVGALAGYEEAGRALARQALDDTAVLAWTSGFDGATPDPGGDHRVRLRLHLATSGGPPLTLTALRLHGRSVDLAGPVRLEPGEAAVVRVRSQVDCSGADAAGQADVHTDAGTSRAVPVRTTGTGLDAVLRTIACTQEQATRTPPAEVTAMRALATGALEVDLVTSDTLPPVYVSFDLTSGQEDEWSLESDHGTVAALLPGQRTTVALRLTRRTCPSGDVLPDVHGLLAVSVSVGFDRAEGAVVGWDDEVAAAAATAAVARACA